MPTLVRPGPDDDDVVIRADERGGTPVFFLGTMHSPDQLMVHTLDAAQVDAIAFARHHHVRVWMVNANQHLVLLNDYRVEGG